MVDTFQNQDSGIAGPFTHASAVTPHDANDLAFVTRAIWVGAAGNLVVTTLGGNQVTFTGFGPGWLPGRIQRVHASGTTATGLVAVW